MVTALKSSPERGGGPQQAVEGAHRIYRAPPWGPTTTTLRVAVPLPAPGRI